MITYRLALFVRIGSVAASAVAGLMWRRVGEQRFVSLVSGPPGRDTIQGEVGQALHQQRQCGDEFGIWPSQLPIQLLRGPNALHVTFTPP